jgi:hypothetical protein
MDRIDPGLVGALLLMLGLLGGYLQYLKVRIHKLDRIIAEKEAALNAAEQPPTAAR